MIFNNDDHQDLRLVEVKMNYMMLTLAKPQYLLGLVFTLNNAMLVKLQKEKRENEEIGYCDFELKNVLLTFLS